MQSFKKRRTSYADEKRKVNKLSWHGFHSWVLGSYVHKWDISFNRRIVNMSWKSTHSNSLSFKAMTKGGTDKSKYLEVISVLVKRITLKVPKSPKAQRCFKVYFWKKVVYTKITYVLMYRVRSNRNILIERNSLMHKRDGAKIQNSEFS